MRRRTARDDAKPEESKESDGASAASDLVDTSDDAETEPQHTPIEHVKSIIAVTRYATAQIAAGMTASEAAVVRTTIEEQMRRLESMLH